MKWKVHGTSVKLTSNDIAFITEAAKRLMVTLQKLQKSPGQARESQDND